MIQHNRLICVFKEFFSVFWTNRGRRCTFYRFSVVLLVIRFCKSVTKGQCFQDKQKGQCHTVGLHLKGKQTSLTLGVLCLPQFAVFLMNTRVASCKSMSGRRRHRRCWYSRKTWRRRIYILRCGLNRKGDRQNEGWGGTSQAHTHRQ